MIYVKLVKRFIDIFVSLIGLIVLSWFLIIVSLLIVLDSKGPVIFKQKRLGLKGKEFNIYKFRTMTVGAELIGSGQYSFKGDPRVTRVGKILRATSIDELPQFINILKGDMSLIGPRPPLVYHPYIISEYSKKQLCRFNIRPGVTGWAQVHGRKQVRWEKRIQDDIWYVENCSFLLDVKIFFMTIHAIFLNKSNINIPETVIENRKEK